ncbi:hypothetical protein C2E23DRAFT_828558 [Lenzites betulinus]|nr:hypothetical protein C2E23DRAFT_828558 [Lenzites betulinus]
MSLCSTYCICIACMRCAGCSPAPMIRTNVVVRRRPWSLPTVYFWSRVMYECFLHVGAATGDESKSIGHEASHSMELMDHGGPQADRGKLVVHCLLGSVLSSLIAISIPVTAAFDRYL